MRPRSALCYSLLLLALAASAAIQAQPKTLAVCTEAAPEGFDPARYTSGYTFDASAHPLYNALAAFAPGSATVIPALAESWDVSADGLVYTFRLRQGVKFHSTDYFKPTREFDADDVLFSFQRMLDPQHPAHDLSPSGYPYADAMQLRDIIERIEKIDEHQVRFVLKHPEAPFLADLAMPFGSILSAEYAGQLIARGKGDELNSKPIGTGPFVFTRYRKDAQVRYAANPDYWKGKPAIDHLVLAITLDPNVRVQRLRRNECQIALTPKPEDVAALRQDPQLTVLEEAAMITSHAAINTRHEPFDDPRVRRAIAMGFNKSSYLKIVFGDQARPAIGPYPPMLLGYDDSIRDWPYDPERAKALLKEAGVTPDTPLNLYISTGSGPGGNPARVAQLIQSDLAAIGIRVNIRQFEWGELIKSVEKVDELTVRFVLNRPEAPFLRDMAMPFASIYSAEYGDQLLAAGKQGQLNNQPIGTGPFVFKRYAKDAQVRYTANPDYYAGKPPIDNLVFAITLDPNVRMQKVRAGECQVSLYPKPEDVPRLKQDPNLAVDEIDALLTTYIAINTQHKPLDDPRVRQAINLALDKKAMLDAVFGPGAASPAVGPYPPTLLGYNHSIQDWPHDPERARALLKEAGAENLRITLFIRNGTSPTIPNPALAAQMLQADLAKAGIQLTIRSLEWGELLKRSKAGEHDLSLLGWAGDNGDPDNFLSPNLSCAAAESGENQARWCDKDFEALMRKAREVSDPAERAKLYEQAQVVFHEQAPWIPLAYPKLFNVRRNTVQGYVINPLSNNNFATTSVKP